LKSSELSFCKTTIVILIIVFGSAAATLKGQVPASQPVAAEVKAAQGSWAERNTVPIFPTNHSSSLSSPAFSRKNRTQQRWV
jgi:hypothetical protein